MSFVAAIRGAHRSIPTTRTPVTDTVPGDGHGQEGFIGGGGLGLS